MTRPEVSDFQIGDPYLDLLAIPTIDPADLARAHRLTLRVTEA